MISKAELVVVAFGVAIALIIFCLWLGGYYG